MSLIRAGLRLVWSRDVEAHLAEAGFDRRYGARPLQRAVELGYRHFRHMVRDPDLKALRRDPRFARILRRI